MSTRIWFILWGIAFLIMPEWYIEFTKIDISYMTWRKEVLEND